MSTHEFGGWLKHAREARGLSVEAIALQTKIPPRHLEALERGDSLRLPPFYQRAEVRAVARAVGVDERLAVARLEAELEPTPLPPAEASEPRRLHTGSALGLLGTCVLVAGLAAWGPFDRTAAKDGAAETPAQPDTAPAAPVAPPSVPLPAELPGAIPIGVDNASLASSTPGAPAASSELVINTQPEGARVTVDGIGWGAAPVVIRHLEPGDKHIRVTMDGYAAIERHVTVGEGGRETVRIRLSSQPGTGGL
jgi:transcriptional regulator with XRE-family HTH domain